MKILQKIRNTIKTPKKILLGVSALAVLVAVPLAVNAGFFPDRPTFDYNNFNGNTNCADPANPARNNGRCGSLNGPVFNSFVNVPGIGDERAFLDGFRSDQTQPGTHADPVTNVTDGAKEVTMRLYIHNNANAGTNCLAEHRNAEGICSQIDPTAPGVARNTKVKIDLPNVTGSALRAVGHVTADNATPTQIDDTIDMTSTSNFTVAYEPGSARIFNNGPFKSGAALSDSIVTSGAPVGYSALDGIFPGCFEFVSTVEIKVRITPVAPKVNNMTLTKQVRITGTKTWNNEVAAKPGDDVQWLLDTKNVGETDLTNVITRDVLPPHVQLDPGSVQFVNAKGTQTLADAPLFAGGYNAGLFNPKDNTLITFKTKVLGDFDTCSVRVRNVAHANSTQTPEDHLADADVVITKENCQPPQPPAPVYSCDLLTAVKGDNRNVAFTTAATANNGATITVYHYTFGDGTPELVTDKASVTHQYAKDGQFAARVRVQVAVNGSTQFADSAKCAVAVNFVTPPTPPNTPVTPVSTTPTTLVNTGPGSIAAIFAVVTALGAIAHRWYLGRRLSA